MDDSFENIVKDKLKGFELAHGEGSWEAVSAGLRRRRTMRVLRVVSCSAAACLLFFLALYLPSDPKSPVPDTALQNPAPTEFPRYTQPQALTIVGPTKEFPPSLAVADKAAGPGKKESPVKLSPGIKDLVAQKPVPGGGADSLLASSSGPVEKESFEELSCRDPQQQDKKKYSTVENLYLQEENKRKIKLYRQWIAAVNVSYQGAMGGNYLFTPSTYTNTQRTDLLADVAFEQSGEIATTSHYSTPLSVGINLQKEVFQWFSIGVALNYSLLRSEYSVQTLDTQYTVAQQTHYIGLPVTLYFHAINTKTLSLYAIGGGAVEKGIVDSYTFTTNSTTTRSHEGIEGFQWSVYGGIGVEYKCLSFMGIYLEPSVTHYFDNDQPKSIRTVQPTQFKVELGVRFRI